LQPDSNTSNLRRLVDILARRGGWILSCFVLAVGAALGVSELQTKRYTSAASLLFKSSDFNQQIAGLPNNITSQAEQKNNLRLVEFSNVAAATASALGPEFSQRDISEAVTVTEQGESAFAGESNVVDVSASARSPAIAAEIANAYASRFVAQQRIADQQYFESALKLVETQLRTIPRGERFSTAAVALQTRAQSLRLLAELQHGAVQVGQSAVVSTSPSSPRTSRNLAIGALLGLLAGFGVAFLLEHLDTRIRQPGELATIFGAPLLGTVAKSTSIAAPAEGTPGAPATEGEAESFGLMLAHLRSFNADRNVRTVLVASPMPRDGNTTVAVQLAKAAARRGSRVLLLEVNMRRPAIATQLQLQPSPGLAEVVTGAIPFEEGTQSSSDLPTANAAITENEVDVLVSGNPRQINPAQLLESYAMEVMLAQAQAAYDFVVLDAPPLATVSDAFPLLTQVDGVLIVGRIGSTRSDVADRLRQVLASSHVPVLGVVANGVRARARSFYAREKTKGDNPAVVPQTASLADGSRRPTRA
jgi:Mrp family chromosome partitioning ATPase